MKRGEIWWAELPAPVGNRPVIILTRDAVLDNIGSVVVALARSAAPFLMPFWLARELGLGRHHGLDVDVVFSRGMTMAINALAHQR